MGRLSGQAEYLVVGLSVFAQSTVHEIQRIMDADMREAVRKDIDERLGALGFENKPLIERAEFLGLALVDNKERSEALDADDSRHNG